MDREAMKQALEALEQIHVGNLTPMAEETWNKAITILRQALETEQEEDDRFMTVVYRNVQKEDAQSFTDHPKAVWFGWCHAPYQRDDAIFKLEKAITSPPASKQWVGLTDEQVEDGWEFITGHSIFGGDRSEGRAMYISPDEVIEFYQTIEAKLKEKNT